MRDCETAVATVGKMLLKAFFLLIILPTLILLLPAAKADVDSDKACLQEIKDSIVDSLGLLRSWNFSNPSLDYCKILGVTCLHGLVYQLRLANLSLSGKFPRGLSKCNDSLTEIDLSGNQFTGPISPTLCKDAPYLVTINLANNHFDGSIPEDVTSCYYLNNLYLQNNALCGPVPLDLNNKNILPRFENFEFYGNRCKLDSRFRTRRSLSLTVGIAVGALVVSAMLGFLLCWWLSRFGLGRRASAVHSSRCDEFNGWIKQIKAPNSIVVSMFEKPVKNVKLSDLMKATDDFSEANVISRGRSGPVYKGSLSDGSFMVIKRLEAADTSNQEPKFQAEMEILGKLKHRNLVPLLRYCLAGKETLLVYKHMTGGSLKDLLEIGLTDGSDRHKAPPADIENGLLAAGPAVTSAETPEEFVLAWETRLRLAIGIARGLAWLHHSCNPRVLHRNISPNSILLDDDLEPRIANFGLARLVNPADTHLSTFVSDDFGEVGYAPPEYMNTMVATAKGDVYSFGVVLLQLITRRSAAEVNEHRFRGSLARWIWVLYISGKVEESIDKTLIDGVRDGELIQFLKLAISCINPAPNERPTAYEIFHMLRAIGEKYHLTDENDEIFLAGSTL